jgi:hypothetical protein
MRVRGVLAAALCVVGVAAIGTGPALADPDQPPVDPQVVDVPPPAPWQPPIVMPPPPAAGGPGGRPGSRSDPGPGYPPVEHQHQRCEGPEQLALHR